MRAALIVSLFLLVSGDLINSEPLRRKRNSDAADSEAWLAELESQIITDSKHTPADADTPKKRPVINNENNLEQDDGGSAGNGSTGDKEVQEDPVVTEKAYLTGESDETSIIPLLTSLDNIGTNEPEVVTSTVRSNEPDPSAMLLPSLNADDVILDTQSETIIIAGLEELDKSRAILDGILADLPDGKRKTIRHRGKDMDAFTSDNDGSEITTFVTHVKSRRKMIILSSIMSILFLLASLVCIVQIWKRMREKSGITLLAERYSCPDIQPDMISVQK